MRLWVYKNGRLIGGVDVSRDKADELADRRDELAARGFELRPTG